MTPANKPANGFPLWSKISAGVLISLLLSVGSLSLNTRLSLAEVHSNRLTNQDGKEIWEEISRIKERIAAIPIDVPPAWFIERVNRIDQRLSVIEREITQIRKDP